ncbi:MAG: hypothetical protein V5A37_03780 [Halobacteriales archaeon]
MATVTGVLVGAALVLGAVLAVLARHVYLSLPEAMPPAETALTPAEYAAVRAGLVAGGAIGTAGAAVAVLDTVGTVTAVGPGERGLPGDMAAAIPEWVATTGLLAGAALLALAGVLAVAAELRAWLAS